MQFTRATKRGKFLRLALEGPAGSGKTWTALEIATELAGPQGRIALIDSERESADLYANQFIFDSGKLNDFSPDNYCKSIKAAEDQGYDVCIVDSLTHAWSGTGGALDMVDVKKRQGGNNNSFDAWRDVTPAHNKLVDTLLNARMHVIVTMRTKTAYDMEEYTDKSGNRRVKPVKIGTKPIQREGLEYEFTVVGDLDLDHNLIVSKTRINVLDGKVWHKPGAEFARTIMNWFEDAAEEVPKFAPPAPDPDGPARRAQWERWLAIQNEFGLDVDYLKTCMANYEIAEFKSARPSDLAQMLDAVEAQMRPQAPPPPKPAPAPAVPRAQAPRAGGNGAAPRAQARPVPTAQPVPARAAPTADLDF